MAGILDKIKADASTFQWAKLSTKEKVILLLQALFVVAAPVWLLMQPGKFRMP